jgi:hypothetical protein
MTHIKIILLAVTAMLINPLNSQIPLLNSNPSATGKVIYLDFDGQKVSGTAWNGGNLINAAPSTASAANILQIWKRVSEDYRPFDVNVTTDSTKFNNAFPNRRIRVIFTPTSSWFGQAGGVAYLNSFTWGGTPGTPCWVFENQLGYSPKNMSEAASHEVGHTLSLRHQSTYNSSCGKINEYHPGLGTGVTSWAPIMGVGYSKNVTIWHNGPNAVSCTNIQFDHGSGNPGITGLSFLSFLPDDIGNTFASAKIMNLNNLTTLDSGIITQPTDIDAFRFTICNNRYVTFSVKPFALDTINYSGANLDIRLHIYDASNNLLALDTTLTRLHAIRGLNLTPGSYYFTVDGGRSANYSDYGSLGKYYVSIRATNPPLLTNSILTTSFCAGQNVMLNASSVGAPLSWQWSVSTPSATTNYTAQNPSVILTAGINTISLITSNSTATSCPFTQTVNVGSAPVINISGAQNIACPGYTTTLMASGALTYTWWPGGNNGSSNVVSPNVNTTYTVRGSNGSCASDAVATLTVSPPFNVSVAASSSALCNGETLTLTASGAASYTFQPGIIVGNPVTFNPLANTSYVVYGSVGSCVKSTSLFVTVVPQPTINATVSEDFVCLGGDVIITSAGAAGYTIEPGGYTGKSVTVSPLGSIEYTVTGATGVCSDETTLFVTVGICDVGITEETLRQPLIFPNPAYDQLSVKFHDNTVSMSILNTTGALIQDVEVKDLTEIIIHTGELPRGVYFIKVGYKDSGFVYQRIVLQ